jgi:hypothetical protein
MTDDYAVSIVRFTRALIVEFATERPRLGPFVTTLREAAEICLTDELGIAEYARARDLLDSSEGTLDEHLEGIV